VSRLGAHERVETSPPLTYAWLVELDKDAVVLGLEPKLAQSRLDLVGRVSALVDAHCKANSLLDCVLGNLDARRPALHLSLPPLHFVLRALLNQPLTHKLLRPLNLDILSTHHSSALVLLLRVQAAPVRNLVQRAARLEQRLGD